MAMNATSARAIPRAAIRLPDDWPWQALRWSLLALLAVQGARLVYAAVTPVRHLGAWQARAPQPLDTAAQIALFRRFDPFYRQQAAAATGPGTVTALPLTLFGIRANSATGGGSAIIAGADGVQLSIGVGEEIQPGVRLVGVAFDHVTIERAGARELLYMDQAEGAAAAANDADATGGAALAVPAAATGPAVAAPPAPISPASIRAGVSFAPRSAGGRVTGVSVSAQGDGSAFAALGLRPGDVIRSVNGRAIASAGDVAALSSQLQPGARLSLEVERGAGTANIAVLIPNGNP